MFTIKGRKVLIAKGSQDLSQVIHHEAISGGEHLAPDDRHFPARQVTMQPVQIGGIIILLRQFAKQIRVLQHISHIMLSIAHKGHGCFCTQGFNTTGESLISHVVLHDIHKGFISLLLASGKLIKSNYIPEAHQAYPAIGIVHKELGD
ncbi:hypothetical protein DSECCO2_506980 [anaerobic digester metagenome]